MILSKDNRTMRVRKNEGGKGNVAIDDLLTPEQRNGKTRMFAQVTLEPGCALGYHEHHHESEAYYILSGEGVFNDNGTCVPVRAGDVAFTPDGAGHALENTSDVPLHFIALILPA